jgi:hypothetical protein
MHLSLQLRGLQTELAAAKKELEAVEANYFAEKKNLVEQLDSNEKEIKKLANSRDIDIR